MWCRVLMLSRRSTYTTSKPSRMPTCTVSPVLARRSSMCMATASWSSKWVDTTIPSSYSLMPSRYRPEWGLRSIRCSAARVVSSRCTALLLRPRRRASSLTPSSRSFAVNVQSSRAAARTDESIALGVSPGPGGSSTRIVPPCGTAGLPGRTGVRQALWQPLGVLRLSHLELRVLDLELAAAYYTEVVGLVEVGRDEERLYLKCWDEQDHHSLTLCERAGPGLEHVSFKVEREEDLAELEAAAQRHGCSTRRVAAGAEAGQGPAVRLLAPSGHE